MTNLNSYMRFLVIGTALIASILANEAIAVVGLPTGYVKSQVAAEYAAYDIEPFNLLLDKKSLMDGKNHYSKEFSAEFDRLILQVSVVKSKKDFEQLKRRLLSGPAARPRFLKQESAAKNYIYYEMCQAHACDVINIGLLYSPQSKNLFARLFLNGKVEFLGAPSDEEKLILTALTANSGK